MTRSSRSFGKLDPRPSNVAREGYDGVTLKCGCQATGPAITHYPDGRRYYRCDVHGLQMPRRR